MVLDIKNDILLIYCNGQTSVKTVEEEEGPLIEASNVEGGFVWGVKLGLAH